MNIKFSSSFYQIDASGAINRAGVWKITPGDDDRADSSWNGFQQQVEQWAGNAGGPWRNPVTGPAGYEPDAEFIVTAIEIKQQGEYCYEVSFTAAGRVSEAQLCELSENKNSDGRNEKTAKWKVAATTIASWLPANGENVEWAGTSWRCQHSSTRRLNEYESEITICARDTATIMLGMPARRRNAQYENIVIARWQVDRDDYQNFLDSHQIGSAAPEWAGENYRISRVDALTAGNSLYEISVEAIHSAVTLLEVTCTETLAGYDGQGSPMIDTLWHGRWKINRDAINEFSQLVGTSAAAWAAENCIVTSAEYLRSNELEYECRLEARSPERSFGYSPLSYHPENNDYSGRKEITLDTGSFFLFPEQGGWWQESSGGYQRQSSWRAADSCPFVTAEPLPVELLNRELICLILTVTVWHRGHLHQQLATEIAWSAAGKIVNSAEGFAGNWRKIDLSATPVTDNNGDVWTKITRKYLHAPDQLNWNANFWK